MFEDLRNDGELSPLFQQQEETDPMLDGPVKKKGGLGNLNFNIKFGRKFLGMTAFQRFVLSLAIMVMASVVSLALLIVTGAIALF